MAILEKIKSFFPRSKPKTQPPEETALSSTDLAGMRNRKAGALNAWIQENMFIRTAANIVPIDRNGAIVAMDSKGYKKLTATMDSDDIKSAFTMSNNRLPQVLFSWYCQQSFIGYQACSIIAQQWLVQKACSVPPKDAIKNGYELTVNDGTKIDLALIKQLRDRDKKFRINKNLKEYSTAVRTFGIRIALFKVESTDPNYYIKPFNIDGVTNGSYKGISQVDPYWISPELDADATGNPASPNFYEPTWWRISGQRYHRTHLIITRNKEVSDLLKPSYMYGGIPLPQMIYERVYQAERMANEGPQLALTKRTTVMKTDITKAMLDQEKFEERLALFNSFRDNYSTLAIGQDEEISETDTALNGLDPLIMTQYQLVAAIAEMPATKLINTTPKGFQSTGEFETDTYYDLLEGIQGDDEEVLERHYELLIKSEVDPAKQFKVEIKWNPLRSPSTVEISDNNLKKAQTDESLRQSGAIDRNDIRNRIIADPNSGYNGIEEFEDLEGDDDDDYFDGDDNEDS